MGTITLTFDTGTMTELERSAIEMLLGFKPVFETTSKAREAIAVNVPLYEARDWASPSIAPETLAPAPMPADLPSGEGNAVGAAAAPSPELPAASPSSAPAVQTPPSDDLPNYDTDVVPAVGRAATAHGRQPVLGVLATFGVDHASKLDAAQWRPFLDALEALGAGK